MKPETENVARQLARVLLDDRADHGRLDNAGVGVVEIEMRGMVRTIRQQILVDHVSLAGKIADEIERQTTGLDLDALIAKSVAAEVARVKATIPALVEKHVRETVNQHVHHACSAAAAQAVLDATKGVTERLYAVAYPPPKKVKR